jgi:hypothetical protein
MEGKAVGHNIERGPPKDHPSQIFFNLAQRFQRRRFKCDRLSKCETAEPNYTKAGRDGPWVGPFQNCVRQLRPHSRWLLLLKWKFLRFSIAALV